MRFAYDDSYHTDLSMAPYKVLCEDHIGCLGIGQDQKNMSLWISDHGRYNRKVRTIGERLVIAKELLDGCVDFPSEEWNLGFEVV